MIDILDVLSPHRPFTFTQAVVVYVCLHADITVFPRLGGSLTFSTRLSGTIELCGDG